MSDETLNRIISDPGMIIHSVIYAMNSFGDRKALT